MAFPEASNALGRCRKWLAFPDISAASRLTFHHAVSEYGSPPAAGVTTLRDWTTGVQFPAREMMVFFLVIAMSRPALGPTDPPIQWVPGLFTTAIKRTGREADRSPPSSGEVKNGWSYTSTPTHVFMEWCSFKHLYLCLYLYHRPKVCILMAMYMVFIRLITRQRTAAKNRKCTRRDVFRFSETSFTYNVKVKLFLCFN
jgi:hypothetical protein